MSTILESIINFLSRVLLRINHKKRPVVNTTMYLKLNNQTKQINDLPESYERIQEINRIAEAEMFKDIENLIPDEDLMPERKLSENEKADLLIDEYLKSKP